MSNRKVFIVHKGTQNFKGADRFGTIIYLTKGFVDMNKLEEIVREMGELFKESNPEDYILLSGPTLLQILACSEWARYWGDSLNLVIFEGGEYIEKKCVFSDNK